MLLPVFLPFNLIKSALNAALTMLIYKPVSRALKRSGLVERAAETDAPRGGRRLGAMLIAALVLVSCIVAVLVMRGVI